LIKMSILGLSGAPTRTRTADLLITNQLLLFQASQVLSKILNKISPH
jgi:hypothetical protein